MYRQIEDLPISYPIFIGHGIIEGLGEIIKSNISGVEKIAVITDVNVSALWDEKVVVSLQKSGYKTVICDFLRGEIDKTPQSVLKMIGFLQQSGLTRYDLVLTLGGGVVGDVGGFAAATYLRGVGLVHVPTSVIGQVDSSIGGKTGVDLEAGKNLWGAFYDPLAVVCDGETLKTLPREELFNGYGEICKYCLLSEDVYRLYREGASFDDIVEACIRYKANAVAADPKDMGERRLLNLGHTFGHGIEVLSNFKIAHGEAVMYGLEIICDLSLGLGYLSECEHKRIRSIIAEFSGGKTCPFTKAEIFERIVGDKKRKGDGISLALTAGVGNCFVRDVGLEKIKGLCLEN